MVSTDQEKLFLIVDTDPLFCADIKSSGIRRAINEYLDDPAAGLYPVAKDFTQLARRLPRSPACGRKPILPHITTAYKIVERVDGNLQSIYDPDTKYVLGKRIVQKARGNHNGGYYTHEDRAWLRQNAQKCFNASLTGRTLVMLECECIGTPVRYSNKNAYSIVKPTAIVDEWVE